MGRDTQQCAGMYQRQAHRILGNGQCQQSRMVLALVDTGVERKVNHASLSNLVQHLPRCFRIREVGFQIDVRDAAARTLFIKD